MNRLLRSGFAALAITASGSPSLAQSFKFQAHDEEATVASGLGAAGQPVLGQMVTGSSVSQTEGEPSIAGRHKCASLFNVAADQMYKIHMICEVTASSGDFVIVAGCNPGAKATVTCLGEVTGKSGQYAGRRGLVTIYTADKSVSGVGQWLK